MLSAPKTEDKQFEKHHRQGGKEAPDFLFINYFYLWWEKKKQTFVITEDDSNKVEETVK